jgi:hypothetical protein
VPKMKSAGSQEYVTAMCVHPFSGVSCTSKAGR